MPVANPYFINIVLCWPDGRLANQNEIARVRAADVNGSVETDEGQSGFNPATGGWFPVYMQNIAAFYPERQHPNLYFRVESTQEEVVHTTQVFNAIPSNSTVKITIGQGAEIIDGEPDPTFQVSGTISVEANGPLTEGLVRAYDMTIGSEVQVGGTAILMPDGTYLITFAASEFENNGTPHTAPNLLIKVFNGSGVLLATSGVVNAAPNPAVIDLTVPDTTSDDPPVGGQRRVFGSIVNTLGLPVSDLFVCAYHLAWTVEGLQEIQLGTTQTSDAGGNYEVLYDLPVVPEPGVACSTPEGQINLIVYVKQDNGSGGTIELTSSDVIYNAAVEERVDLEVDAVAQSTDSEYRRVHAAISNCLGQDDGERYAALNQLKTRADYRAFVAQASEQTEELVLAYVLAWLTAGEIDKQVPSTELTNNPFPPEVVYALIRAELGQSLAELVNVSPDQFFNALVSGIHQGIVSSELEPLLPSLLDDWRTALSRLLVKSGATWQKAILDVVFGEDQQYPEVAEVVETAVGANQTSHPVVMPGAVNAGDLLLVVFSNDSDAQVTAPAGWTELWDDASTNQMRFGGYAKIADGSEGSQSYDFQTSAAEEGAAQVFHIAAGDWFGDLTTGIKLGPVTTGNSNSLTFVGVNVDSLPAPDWAGKTLYIACAGYEENNPFVSGPPGYAAVLHTPSSNNASAAATVSARLESEDAPITPGPFSIQGNTDWATRVIAIRPNEAGNPELLAKKQAVTEAHYDAMGELGPMLELLIDNGTLSELEAENLRFALEMYERVGREISIVRAVFPDKEPQNWHSIDDLARVPVTAASGPNWVSYASQSSIPNDIGGSDPSERARVYAERLFALFGGISEKTRFADDLTSDATSGGDTTLQGVADFLNDNPDFDLESSLVDRFIDALPAADRPSSEVISKLKQLQRVFRVAGDYAAATKLLELGFDSALKISRTDEDRFVADYEDDLGSLTKARKIHRTASHYASETLFTVVKFNQNLNDIGGISALPGAPQLALLPSEGYDPDIVEEGAGTPDARKFPNWITLFGNLNKCACEHCQTVLSPGAYLVDLLQFVEGAPRNVLFERRPDLQDIELTCANTNTVLPYIDLVNELLESAVEPQVFELVGPGQVLDDAASAGTVPSLLTDVLVPNGINLSDQATFKKLDTETPEWVAEDGTWRVAVRGNASPFSVHLLPQTSSENDTLEVFPEHVNQGAYQKLEQAVFPFNLPLALGREQTELFLEQKAVPRYEVREAFSTDPIESVDPVDGQSKLLDPAAALAYLKLSVPEAEAILGQTAGLDPWNYWGFDAAGDTAGTEIEIPRPDKPTQTIIGSWIDLLSVVPVFLHRTGLSYSELVTLMDTRFVHLEAADAHGLHIVGDTDDIVECNTENFQVAHLNQASLQRISFFLRLWQRLGWSMREVDALLMDFEAGNIPGDLVRVALVKRLTDEFDLKPLSAMTLWARMDRRRTERVEKSLFDAVFLKGAPGQLEYQGIERVALGGEIDLTAVSDADYASYIRAALKLEAIDVERLYAELGISDTLGIDHLTAMYRASVLSRALRVSVSDIYDTIDLLGIAPFFDPSTPIPDSEPLVLTYDAIRELRRIASTRMGSAEIDYYLRDSGVAGDAFRPTQAGLEQAVVQLAQASRELESALEPITADAAGLQKALPQVIPQDKVVRALDLLSDEPEDVETPLDPAVREEFFARYFAPFLPEDPTTLLAELSQQSIDEALRFAAVAGLLSSYLANKAQRQRAVATAAALVGLTPDVADLLLESELSSVDTGTPAASAIEDWKRLVAGGFGTDSGSIVDEDPGSFSGRLVIPQDGEYRFVASVNVENAGASVELTLNGDLLTPTAEQNAAGRSVYVFEERFTLKAGSVHDIRFSYAGSDQVSLLWEVNNADGVAIPKSSVIPFESETEASVSLGERAYRKLFKAAGLVRGLELSTRELKFMLESELPVISLDSLPTVAGDDEAQWSQLKATIDLLALKRSLRFKEGTLFDLLGIAPAADETDTDVLSAFQTKVSELTEWREEDIVAVDGLWQTDLPGWNDPARWYVLRAGMDIVRRLDLRAQQIIDLLVDAEPSIAVAGVLRNLIQAQFGLDTFKQVFKPLSDKLRQRQRDALVGYLTTRTVTLDGSDYSFFDENDLFAHFLIDVEMEPDTLLSRIKLALNSIQLFVQRVFLGLEEDSALIELEKAKKQWVWMKNFRVWEANRKVFLYPENWIRPELRDDKTEFFQELEDQILQDEISDQSGKIAVIDYLDKLNEVGNLEVVGAYVEETFAGGENYTLHVIGRTRSQSRVFYYRTFHGKKFVDGTWNPWKRIKLDIQADVVAPVVFNGRLYLTWPMVELKQRGEPTSEFIDGNNAGDVRGKYQANIKLMWSEYVSAENKWLKPKLSKHEVIDSEVPLPHQLEVGQDQTPTEFYHLRTVPSSVEYFKVEVVRTNPTPELGGLKSTQIGIFTLWSSGNDTIEHTSKSITLGENWAAATVLRNNACIEVEGFQVDSEPADDTFRFKGNLPFFERTPDIFRVMGANLPSFKPDRFEPFFFENTNASLFAINRGPKAPAGLSQQARQQARFFTFNHPLVPDFQKELSTYGMNGLMSRKTEALPVSDHRYYSNYYYNYYGNLYLGYHIAGDRMAWGTTQRIFEGLFRPRLDTVEVPYPLPTVEFGYGTPFGVYNWELFFHVPMLVADRLSQDMKFEDAMKWYHYVFDPNQDLSIYEKTKSWVKNLPTGARYWTFLPFFANQDVTDSLLDTLGLRDDLTEDEHENLSKLIDDWKRTPFNPHLIARQRLVAYQKNVVMRYLDNLISWADQLFRIDSFESINEATQLYILAAEILGDRPEDIPALTGEPRFTYREISASSGFDDFSNAIVEVENLLVSHRAHLRDIELEPPAESDAAIKSVTLQTAFFKIPRNERLDSYWDTVQDRLFKIRNSLNIDGVKRTLALFQPPIDPALLVSAAALGLDLSSVVAQLNAPLPHYRYSVWVQRATDLVNEVRGFGGALLSALEKKDAEELQLLRQGQELRILELVRRVREDQVREAEENITALERSRDLAQERHEEYRKRERVSSSEKLQQLLTQTAVGLDIVQGGVQALGGVLSLIPDIETGIVGPFPVIKTGVFGGQKMANVMNFIANVSGTAANVSRGGASLAGIGAGYQRRWEDFKLQERLAKKEMDQIDQQLVAARVRLQIAEKELSNHETQIEQSEEVRQFLEDKFTSRELYQWMVSELSRTYQRVFRLAFDVARTAERTWQFELGVTDQTFIRHDYFDSLRQGLLAGEKMAHDIKRMEVLYLERNKRELEITKQISLAQLNGEQLQQLRETGSCEFEVPEVLFDLDFPGQYFRRIKAVRVTIPCVTGPYTSVSAKLSLLGSAFRKQSTADVNDYPYKGFDDPRFVHDLVGIQSIATSTAQNDAGLFELNFRDERYLPFEGAGAVSRWRLELPEEVRQFDYNTISDVVMSLSYTARDAGGSLKEGALTSITTALNSILTLAGEETGLVRVFSLKKEFPDVFHQLLNNPDTVVNMTLVPEHFPFVVRSAGSGLEFFDGNVELRFLTKDDISGSTFELNSTAAAPSTDPVTVAHNFGSDLLPNGDAMTWPLEQNGLSVDNVDDIVVVLKYKVAA